MDSSDRALTSLQRDVLSVLAGESQAYLGGGAALAAFYLQHRQSRDLDLFTPDADEVERLARRLRAACRRRGWVLDEVQTAPGFRRFAVVRGAERTLVDLVHEPVSQEVPPVRKPVADGIRYDALEDLVANKLAALLGRGDTKDLVDLYFLAMDGHDVLASLPAAGRKDGGMDPTVLAWVARSTPADVDDLLLLRPVSSAELEAFRAELSRQLLAASWPSESEPDSSG